MSHLTLSLFGPFQALLDEKPITNFRSVKNQALLAWLMLESKRPLSRASVAGLCWPDEPEETARLNFRQALFQLRSLLRADAQEAGKEHLLVTTQTVQFNPACSHTIDGALFTTLLETCAKHAHTALDRCTECCQRLTRAVELYRGEFLQGMYVNDSPLLEEWILWRREQFQQQTLDALHTLVLWHEKQQEFESAHRFALRQLEIDPLREEAYRQAMRTLALRGQIDAAIAQYEQCRRLFKKELAADPSEETQRLAEQIKLGIIAAIAPKPIYDQVSRITTTTVATHIAPLHNLPSATNRFVGRQTELDDLREKLLDPASRLITLTGPGGIGKTRLALEAARQIAEMGRWGEREKGGKREREIPHSALRILNFPDGIWYISLVAATTIEAMALTILRTLGAAIQEKVEPLRQLFDHLQRRQLLLLLDNFEQLAEESTVLADLLAQAQGVKLFVTSRFRLRLQAEHVVDLAGLPLPIGQIANTASTAEVLPQSFASVQLFVERARQNWNRFQLNGNTSDVVVLCQLLEGLPLGLELAAGWVDQVSCAEMVRMIRQSYATLSSLLRDTPARQRSLRAVFESSWSLLKPEEQQGLACVGLMIGDFDEAAANAIGAATPPILAALTHKSLLRSTEARRYQLHEMVREFAQEKLTNAPAAAPFSFAQIQQHYCHHYLAVATAESEELIGANQHQAAVRLQGDLNNIRQAWRWASEQKMARELNRSLTALGDFYDLSGLYREAAAEFQATLNTFMPSADANFATESNDVEIRIDLVAELHLQLMRFFNLLGRASETLPLGEQALGLAEASNRPDLLPTVLRHVGMAHYQLGNPDEALRLYEEAVELTASLTRDNPTHLRLWADTRFTLGDALLYQSDQRSTALLNDALATYRQLGDKRNEAWLLNSLGGTALIHHRLDESRHYLESAVQICRDLDDRVREARVLNNLSWLYSSTKNYAESDRCLQQVLQVAEAVGLRTSVMIALSNLGSNQMEQNQLPEARNFFTQSLEHARAMGDKRSEGAMLNNLGNVFRLEGDPVMAEFLLRQSIPLAEQYNERHFLTIRLKNLGLALRNQSRFDEAKLSFEQSLAVAQQIDDEVTASDDLLELGKLAKQRGEGGVALALWQEAVAMAQRCGNTGCEEEGVGLIGQE